MKWIRDGKLLLLGDTKPITTTLLKSLLVISTDISTSKITLCLSDEILKHAKITQLLNNTEFFFQTHNRENYLTLNYKVPVPYYCTQMLFDSGGSQMILLPWLLYPSRWGDDKTILRLGYGIYWVVCCFVLFPFPMSFLLVTFLFHIMKMKRSSPCSWSCHPTTDRFLLP